LRHRAVPEARLRAGQGAGLGPDARMAGPSGDVILLVGPSCAGKSTLAKAVQEVSAEPYLVQSLDGLFAATPDAWGGSGEHTLDGFSYDWSAGPAEDGTAIRRVACG